MCGISFLEYSQLCLTDLTILVPFRRLTLLSAFGPLTWLGYFHFLSLTGSSQEQRAQPERSSALRGTSRCRNCTFFTSSEGYTGPI